MGETGCDIWVKWGVSANKWMAQMEPQPNIHQCDIYGQHANLVCAVLFGCSWGGVGWGGGGGRLAECAERFVVPIGEEGERVDADECRAEDGEEELLQDATRRASTSPRHIHQHWAV